jgi:ABC-type transport system substrate-binding protein
VNYTEITNNGETGYTLLHVTQEGSPLQDRRVRCALAYATDNPALNETIGASVNTNGIGPFSPTQVGYLEDTGFPMEQDMAMAQQLIAEYKAEFPGPITLALATTQDQTNLTIAQFQQQWWTEAGIDEVTIDQIDQAQYILTAALGDFQVFQWRNHGGFDLDQQYFWWHSSASLDPGSLALNFGRIKDPALDALLDENRASTIPLARRRSPRKSTGCSPPSATTCGAPTARGASPRRPTCSRPPGSNCPMARTSSSAPASPARSTS